MGRRKIRTSVPGIAELLRPAAPLPDTTDERPATGRERHDQKITVYLSAAELLELEHARLKLRRFGFVMDRGRLVREAIAVLLADLDARGAESLIARRVRASQENISQDKNEDAVPSLAWALLQAAMSGNFAAADAGDAPRGSSAFEVHLDVFEGPFDLLLGLISKHKLDITEVSLSQVTDEFIAYIRHRSGGWDLDQVSYFLVVAATLLDLKAARLLPSGEVEDEEDLALLEARDLLFARLLQYRAYKEVAAVFAGRMAAAARRFPRRVPLEPRFAGLLPELLFTIGPQEFAALAARALAPKVPPAVSVDHIHAAFLSIREQAVLIAGRLRGLGRASFRQLSSGAAGNYEIVASFLALLELYREDVVAFEQVSPLGDLYVTWTGGDREVQLAAPGARGGDAVPVTESEEEDYL
jgi:segregation and condensation protein A